VITSQARREDQAKTKLRQESWFDDLEIVVEILPALATVRVPRHEIDRVNTILRPICPARQRLKREQGK